MSKIFYDHLIILEEVKIKIDQISREKTEKEELWKIIDELLHHRVLDLILSKLHIDHHPEFLQKFHLAPYDESLLIYLSEKIEDDIEALIINEAKKIKTEILKEMQI